MSNFPTPRNKVMTVREVAEHFGVHISTVYGWSDTGKLEDVGLDVQVRFRTSDVMAFTPPRKRTHKKRSKYKYTVGEPLLSPAEAAKRLNVERHTLRKWVKEGFLQYVRKGGDPGRYLEREIYELSKTYSNSWGSKRGVKARCLHPTRSC